MSHICTQVRYGARWAGRVLEVRAYRGQQVGGGTRGSVKGIWSAASRARLVKTLEAVDWSQLRWPLAWVHLTYPAQGPGDGAEAKGHLRAWKERWRRAFGPPCGPWKMEFQRRGAPHFHLLLSWPEGVGLGELRLWVARAWYEVVGSGDPGHLAAGTTVKEWTHGNPAGYFAGYGSKATKEYQNEAPPGWAPGRWWGLWGIRPVWQEVEVTQGEFVRLRRVLVRLARSRGRRVRVRRMLQGLWMRGNDVVRLVGNKRGGGLNGIAAVD